MDDKLMEKSYISQNGDSGTEQIKRDDFIIGADDPILITGAAGFIGSRVVQGLLDNGFRNLICFARPASDVSSLPDGKLEDARVRVFRGNLVSREDCIAATKDVKVIYHLAAGRGEKSVPDAFMNSVVTTRNLLDAVVHKQCLQRFVNISSFAVYTNRKKRYWRLLDETCPVEAHPELRSDAYDFAKIKQDGIVSDYGGRFGIPYVIVRPGYVYGPGKQAITGRVGLNTFGIFLHLGGLNKIPLTFVDNCAEAIVLAGLKRGIDGEVFNVVDDDLPSSLFFLRQYKRRVKKFRSIYVPHVLSYALCYWWERYSARSQGQLPPAFNRKKWHSYWKKTRYSNEKLKNLLGWKPKVSMKEGLERFFDGCQDRASHA
jgi:nucleoside-diphosphate-sugar epimerase